MAQWGFYFNQDRCIGCKTCVMACKNWNDSRRGDVAVNRYREADYQVPLGAMEKSAHFINPANGLTHYEEFRKFHMKEDWRWVDTHETGQVIQQPNNTFESSFDRRYLSNSCNHCDQPACVVACPEGIIYKEETYGIVLVDHENCISCGECKTACPWEAPQFYTPEFDKFEMSDPKRPKMTKCTLCIDRITEGLKPACVASCWNRALDAGPMEELRKQYSGKFMVTVPEFESDYVESLKMNTKPNIMFKKKGQV